jgi:hypothetical protein
LAKRQHLRPLSRADRLTDSQSAPAVAEADLARLDAAEAHAALEWSRTGGDLPAVDSDRRATILKALSSARSAATAAKSAEASVTQEYMTAANRVPQIDREIDREIGAIILESADAALDDLAKAAAVFAAARTKASIAGELVRSIALAAPVGTVPGLFAELETFATKFQRSAGVQPDDDANSASRIAWRNLEADLRENANVTLGA